MWSITNVGDSRHEICGGLGEVGLLGSLRSRDISIPMIGVERKKGKGMRKIKENRKRWWRYF